MKIGVKIGPALDGSVAEAAREAERIGFDSVWLSERVVTPLDRPHPYEPMVDPWIALAYVAAVTSRVRLGTSVSMIALRPPVLMARELATLDRLSQGRLIVGVGAGWVVEEFSSTGVGFDDRGGRLNECIRAMRHLWTEPERPWKGKHFDLPAVGIVQPLAPGGPPIWAGAISGPGLRRAARLADGFIAVGQTPEKFAEACARIAELRTSYGREGAFEHYVQVAPPADAEAAEELVQAYGAAGADGLIITYADAVPDALVAGETTARALIAAAAAR